MSNKEWTLNVHGLCEEIGLWYAYDNAGQAIWADYAIRSLGLYY